MSGSATTVPGFFPYIGYLLKDVGGRLAIWSHFLRSGRQMYPVMRHQNVRAYRGMLPYTQEACFIAPSAYVCGNVTLGHDACVFYHSVVRNYNVKVPTVIGDHSVVMDRVTLMGQVRIGQGSYIGVGASLDCCEVHDNVYIGAGASVALGAVIENNAIVAPGAAVPKDTRVHAGELWAGNPAQKVADVTPEQAEEVGHLTHHQVHVAHAHVSALHEHAEAHKELDAEWLRETVKLIEQQQSDVALKTSVEVPLEARRFLEPRVSMRRPEMHMRMSYPVNRTAPWMAKAGDQVGNV